MDDSPFNGDSVDFKRARRRDQNTALSIDRLPPHATDAEQGVIGCILTNPNDCLNHCLMALKSGKEVFYDLRHQTIYEAFIEMHEAQEAIDIITTHQWLKDRNILEQIGGISYLNDCQHLVVSSANISYWTDIIKEKHQLRRLLWFCSDIAGRVYEHAGEVSVLLDQAERDIMGIAERSSARRKDINELVGDALDVIQSKFERDGAIAGLSTGFKDIDRYTDGLVAGELIVPAAYPGVGKTSLLMNMVENIVIDQNLPAAVFSLEMTAEQLVTRFLCSNARVNLKKIGEGYMVDSDFPKLTASACRTKKAKLYIIDDVETIAQIRAESRRLKQQYNVAMIGVDYIQRVHAVTVKGATREQEVSAISNGLKSIAKELKVPVVAPSQLNEEGKLRESRAIGQDADNIWMLEQQEDGKTPDFETVNIRILKNRNGPRDVTVPLTFRKEFTRFEPQRKVSENDMPKSRNPHNDE